MLAPDSRALLLDALRPPPGHSLDYALATTFTLDLETALMVPLAFAGFRFDEQPDPIEVMEALRGMSERLDIFCQAGAIRAGKWPSDLLALLEGVIHEVRRPRPGHVFHPKVWVLRNINRSQQPSYRLVVLSRNLTADRSWDTILWLDGCPGEQPITSNEPLARFVAALPEFAGAPLPTVRRDAVVALGEELKQVVWDVPAQVQEACFHPIGLPGSRSFPVEEHFGGDRALAVSPFVRGGALRRLFRSQDLLQEPVLVSRGEELDALPPDVLRGVNAYELDPTATLSWDETEGDLSQAFLTHLHAKLYVVERGRQAHLFVGSANATDAGLGQNVEFLCELVGPVKTLGVDAFVGEDAPFRAMLTPHGASQESDVDETGEAGRALEDLVLDVAAEVRLRMAVTRKARGWVPRVTSETPLPDVSDDTSVRVAPHNRPAETRLLHPAQQVDIEFSPRDLADVTPFLQLKARRTVEGEVLERSTVICSRLEGAPEERFQEVLARQIDTPEKFLRLLALLIGFGSRGGADIAVPGGGSASWARGAGQGVLELLARALSENPESIDHLAAIIEHLRRSPSGRAVLPPGWDDVWLPALEARRSMLPEAS